MRQRNPGDAVARVPRCRREVALAKLSVLLGAGLPASACRDWMGVSVFGEV